MPRTKTSPKKAALITGGAKRMGREIALMLAAEGYDIFIHYHASKKDAETTAKAARKLGVKAEIFSADLRQSKHYKPLMEAAFKTFPHLNLLVNNASIFERKNFAETSEADFDANMAIHLKAPFFLTQHFAKRCKKGQVLNVVDTYITKTTPAYFAYLLSKKGLYEFTRMAARELSPNICVNAVAPGTTSQSKDMSAAYRKKKESTLPMRQMNEFNDVVDVIKFMTNNAKLTGECIFIDAGEQLL